MDNIRLTLPNIDYLQGLLLLRQIDKKFVNVSPQSGEVFSRKWASRGAAFGDIDNDGDIDAVVSTCGGPAHVLRNEGGIGMPGSASIYMASEAIVDGIGAEVKITADNGTDQYGMVTTTAGYLSAQDKRLYFGIPEGKGVRAIHIAWPNGTKQVIANPPMRRILSITER